MYVKKIFSLFLCIFIILFTVTGCVHHPGNEGSTSFSGTYYSGDTVTVADETTGTVPNTIEANLRVLSFNVRMDLQPTIGMINGVSLNRVQAVREQILSYEPDLIGLQEDVPRWIDNIAIDTNAYTAYRPDASMGRTEEYCSIYVRNGIKVKNSGWKWITADGTNNTVALTYSELTDGDGKYDMSAQDLSTLGITNNATLKTTYKDDETGTNYSNKLAARLMNWIVAEVNGQDVIYVNTHFQHRGYNNRAYDEHPLFMLRYYERCAQFDMVQDQIEILKFLYPNASVILTADFNDTSYSGFYEKIRESYTDSMKAAKKGIKIENTWNAAYDNDKQGQGYTATNENLVSGRIDFCFVSDDLSDSVLLYRTGACKWTLEMSEATLVTNVNVYPSDHLPVIVDLAVGKS